MSQSRVLDRDSEDDSFSRSDVGAQSAWKGFSSQTLYIASRIVTDSENYDFYPEDIEDLIVKKGEIVVEAVQVKDISSDLTLSSLASTKTSIQGEGFLKRVCSLHAFYPSLSTIRIVYFDTLGQEFRGLQDKDENCRLSITKKLVDNHGISEDSANWLVKSLTFDKVSTEQLQSIIADQLKDCVPVMAAPDLAQTLLIQYVADLSRTKGNTNFAKWQEQIFQIGTDIAAIDSYYKEYQKSLLRFCDLELGKTFEQLKVEFEQGVSAQPSHIRNNLDFPRKVWLNKIEEMISESKAVIVKGVSGQGKSALCLRYLFDHYPEQLIFCVRGVESSRQAENLAVALLGIAKHTSNMIVYIDVNPGERQWITLIQELQARGASIPVLAAVREEDFTMTGVDESSVDYGLIELSLSEQEGKSIYEAFTAQKPHSQFRSFEEAWAQFGTGGPFLEFVYLLTNNQTLIQRLQAQIEALLRESHPDSWFMLLQLVCFAGKTGCPLVYETVRKEPPCDNLYSAIHRFSNEYLIRESEDGEYLEALHPVRARIICEILSEKIGENPSELVLSAIQYVNSNYIQLLLMDYFSNNPYSSQMISEIAAIEFRDWITCAGCIKTMLWLDVKRYVEQNRDAIDAVVKKHGGGWITFMPLDISGLVSPNEFAAENLASLQNFRTEDIKSETERVRKSLTSLAIDYEATDILISNCQSPSGNPTNDGEWSAFGYSLFWFAKRGRTLVLPFSIEELTTMVLSGDIQSKADAIRGISEQNYKDFSDAALVALSAKLIENYYIIHFNVTDHEVQCSFIPPILRNDENSNAPKNFNHYWKMKMVNLLDQMYPEKEYIEVTLVGVDLLRDLGIEPHDDKARVPKSYRFPAWITEVNSWQKSRIDYYYRPDSWESYVCQIDELRRCSTDLVIDAISYFEFCCKKKRSSKEKLEILKQDIDKLSQMDSNYFLLPETVVDSYCIFREDMRDSLASSMNNSAILQSLSFSRYTNFSKSFRDALSHLQAFNRQFGNVLLARFRGQNVTNIEGSRYPLINLYESAKALSILQKEYNALFSEYRTLEDDFDKREAEGLLTLLNVWLYIFEHPMKEWTAIAYDEKLFVKNSSTIVQKAFARALELIGGEAQTIDEKTYILINFDPLGSERPEDIYKKVVLVLRNEYEKAQSYNSIRWYLETQAPELIYVPIYGQSPLHNQGFLITNNSILDQKEDEISKVMFPAGLPLSLYSNLNVDLEELKQWQLAVGCLGIIKMLIIQYNDVIDTFTTSSAKCDVGFSQYKSGFSNQLKIMITEFSENLTLPSKALELVTDDDDTIAQVKEFILGILDDFELIDSNVALLQQIDHLESRLGNIIGCMLLMQPFVLGGARIARGSTGTD